MNRGFVNVAILVALVVIIAGGGWWYFTMVNSVPAVAELPTTGDTNTETKAAVKKSAATPAQKPATQPVATPASDPPKLIACNPKIYDPVYFNTEKPCVKDMTAEDEERESEAIAIMKSDPSVAVYIKSQQKYLQVSHPRYVVVYTNTAPVSHFTVVDLVGEKVTDSFQMYPGNQRVEYSSKRWVFLGRIGSPGQTGSTGDMLRQYTLGTEKSFILPGSEVYYPQTYIGFVEMHGSMKVLASTTKSVTLGVYDQNKHIPAEFRYEQVGTKTVNLVD